MIKVGITGGETREAGELMRLLINHPDVEIVSVHSPANAGKPVASVHHGFIGEERLLFTANFDATLLDIVFLVRPLHTGNDWAKLMSDRPSLKVVVYPDSTALTESFDRQPVYGLSEINRKALVRGARSAVVPNPAASLALVALYPLARHLMLPDTISLNVALPDDLLAANPADFVAREISNQIVITQTSFAGDTKANISDSGSERGMSVEFSIQGSTPLNELFKIYESVYDDHNFTFQVPMDVDYNEVEGTDKCILSISKPDDDSVRVRAVADARMRGGAGEAVHLMNLLFGLYEKTGLSLKAARF